MKKRTTFQTFLRLIKLVKPLFARMCIAIMCGSLGFFCASFLTVLGGFAILDILTKENNNISIFIIIAVIAIMRGVLHYIEQYNNHYIAFKLLALIRDKVFNSLRSLAPSKLDRKDKGNLISIITSDIELLEVFYAHTVSPICIALITSVVVVIFTASFNIYLGLIVLLSHICVGIIIPVFTSQKAKKSGGESRKNTGALNTYFLESLRGIKEICQFNYSEQRKSKIIRLSKKMENSNKQIKSYMAKTSAFTGLVIMFFSALTLFVASVMYMQGAIEIKSVIIPTLMIFSSFGAVTSVANLGAGLTSTIASANRVLDVLDEKPIVEEIKNGTDINFENAEIKNISFAYDNIDIIKDFSYSIDKNKIIGITGKSGCGKSTLLKLLMRFWEISKGEILISGTNINKINSENLRENQSFVSQETHLFHDTIENNIKIANLNANHKDVVNACKKASVHNFITTLPNGYETEIGELGDTLSGGEKQRIGIARAFLHNANLIMLDEPTSNLDSLNEAVILKSLKETKDKTILIVSHKVSTVKIADEVLNMESGRLS